MTSKQIGSFTNFGERKQPDGKMNAILIDATRWHRPFCGTPVSAKDIGEQRNERCHLLLNVIECKEEAILFIPAVTRVIFPGYFGCFRKVNIL